MTVDPDAPQGQPGQEQVSAGLKALQEGTAANADSAQLLKSSQAVASRPGDTGSVCAGHARACQGLSLPGRGLGPLPPGWHTPTPRGSEPSRPRGWARPGAVYRSSGHSRPAAAESAAS